MILVILGFLTLLSAVKSTVGFCIRNLWTHESRPRRQKPTNITTELEKWEKTHRKHVKGAAKEIVSTAVERAVARFKEEEQFIETQSQVHATEEFVMDAVKDIVETAIVNAEEEFKTAELHHAAKLCVVGILERATEKYRVDCIMQQQCEYLTSIRTIN